MKFKLTNEINLVLNKPYVVYRENGNYMLLNVIEYLLHCIVGY